MPVYLFSYHGRGTWMPDHKRGYTQRNKGVQPRDEAMAANYRRRQTHDTVLFNDDMQHVIID